MMDILLMRSIPGTLKMLAGATDKIREATALRRKKKIEERGEDQMLGVIVQVEGQKAQVAILLKSEVDELVVSQPLKDGFAHARAVALTERLTSLMGGT